MPMTIVPGGLPVSTPRTRSLAAAICLTLFLAMPAGEARAEIPAAPDGWAVQFADDFNGPAHTLPSAARWRFSLGHGYPGGPDNWGTGEIQSYTADTANVSLDGRGTLLITPRQDEPDRWTSARIETNIDTFRPPVGGMMRVQARIRMPDVAGDAALGYWPAFWMLGGPYRESLNWPAVGELDLMENVNGLNRVWAVLHCGTAPGGPCNESSGIGNDAPCPDTTCQSSFHVYALEWDRSVTPAQLRWYVDGTLYHRVGEEQLPAGTWRDMSDHRGYFILLNVAMGGGFPDAYAPVKTPAITTVPGKSMAVDYVAVWTRPGSAVPLLQAFPSD
jgi:hypothetical protein